MFMFLGYIVLSLAMGILAAELLRVDPPSVDPLKDDSHNSAHVRGTMLPILLGTNKIVPIIGYVGNRTTYEKKVGEVDGGLLHSDKDITQTMYVESGIHFLCVGPAYRLSKIVQGGNVIFEGEKDLAGDIIRIPTRANTTSGTQFTCDDDGGSTFKIYWGEAGQPVDSEAAEWTGLSSRYPYTCYIVWNRKVLGQSARWPQIEYHLECAALGKDSDYMEVPAETFNMSCFYTDLQVSTSDADALTLIPGDVIQMQPESHPDSHPLTVTGVREVAAGNYYIYTNPSPGGTGFGTATFECARSYTKGNGVNPADIISQLLFDEYPHGLGMSTALYSTSDLAGIKSYFAIGGTETLPCTIYNKRGETIGGILSGVLADCGIFVYPDAITGQYRFKVIREGETPVEIEADLVNELDTEQVVAHNTLAPDKIMYSFVEAARSFQTSTIVISDDGNARLSGDPNTKKQSITSVTDIRSASIVASRKDQGNNTKEGLRLKVSADLIDKEVGDLLTIENIAGVYRLASKKANPGDSDIELALTRDVYSVENNYSLFTTSGISVPLALVPDLSVLAVDANRYLHQDVAGYYLLRARGAPHIPFASLYSSTDDVDFDSLSSLSYQTAATLDAQMEISPSGFIDELLITEIGSDMADFWATVSMTDKNWRSGAVCMLIDDEYMFPKDIADLGNGAYKLTDVIRGRLGTAVAVHTAGSTVSLFYRNSAPLIEDSTLEVGKTLYLKTRPYSSVEVMPLDENDSITFQYQGGGYRPLPCENLSTTDDVLAWIAGGDLALRWDYKNPTAQAGAGISLTGEATVTPDPEGEFILEIYSGATLYWTETLSSPEYTYTNAQMVSDIGTAPATLTVKVYNSLNGLTSPVEQATFTKV